MSLAESRPIRTSSPAVPMSTEGRIIAFVGLLLALLATAVATWGLPVLAMTALAAVPVIFVCLILITVGK